MEMSPRDLENKAFFFSPSRPSWIFSQLPASHWEEDLVNGGVTTSMDGGRASEVSGLQCVSCKESAL